MHGWALLAAISLLTAPTDAGDLAGVHSERAKVWVVFERHRGFASPADLEAALERLAAGSDPRTVERRRLRRTRPGLFDVDDLPLPSAWLEGVRARGAEIVIASRWAHAVSVLATRAEIRAIAALPYVVAVRPVRRSQRAPRPASSGIASVPEGAGFYGASAEQIAQIHLDALHDLGFTGTGVRVGVLDTGFRTTHLAFQQSGHPLDVVAEHDFVNDDPETGPEPGDTSNQHEHGTYILGVLAAFHPGVIVGGAYDASYILAKVEDVASEYFGEEDMFVAGLEFIEASGGDLATSSVVIFNHYAQAQHDGRTSVMAQGINAATDNGLHVCQGIGNNGHDDDPATSTLVTPADAFDAITVGSVDLNGALAWFTSDGPTADGRVKPEVLARGVNTWTVYPFNDAGLSQQNGASLATPVACSAVACLVQAHPEWTVDQMRTHLVLNGDYYRTHGRPDPLFVAGFGLIDALAAHREDCNANGHPDGEDLAQSVSGDCNANAIPDECDVAAGNSADAAGDGLPDECAECRAGPGCPGEVTGLRLAKEAPHVVLSWQAGAVAAEFTIRRDDTAPQAGTTEVGRTAGSVLTWTDENALGGAPGLAFYLVRGVTVGGVVGP